MILFPYWFTEALGAVPALFWMSPASACRGHSHSCRVKTGATAPDRAAGSRRWPRPDDRVDVRIGYARRRVPNCHADAAQHHGRIGRVALLGVGLALYKRRVTSAPEIPARQPLPWMSASCHRIVAACVLRWLPPSGIPSGNTIRCVVYGYEGKLYTLLGYIPQNIGYYPSSCRSSTPSPRS